MKEGFTLIELLAVIVILAIISLIATPIILNIISDSKESTIISGAEMYIDAVEQEIARENLTNEFSPFSCEVLTSGNVNCDGVELIVEVNGEKPTSGVITLENGKVIDIQNIKFDNYYVYQKDNRLVISKEPIKLIYEDPILNGADPELIGMTPIIYDGNNWVVANTKNKWYDYTNQQWANAVILKSGVTKNVGDTIDVSSEIKAMFVWIPRYEYKIEGTYGKGGTSATSPGEIEVNFISKDLTTPSSSYKIHPAFKFGEVDLSGIWVGKFETSTDTSGTCYTNPNANNCNNLDQDPYIIPNVSSLRYQSVSNQFQTSQKFNTYIENADSHMMKNSEWGAVAYLSQSIYGKYGNSDYIVTEKEVYINNSKSFYTGRSGGNVGGSTPIKETYTDQTSTAQSISYGYYTYDGYLLSYNTNTKTETRNINKGTGASTTGNITGVYDMSGGSWDRVMGNYNNTIVSAEFTSMPESKYYDLYTTATTTTACNKGICYGQALSETANWYGDYKVFISSSNAWLSRSGHYNNSSNAGVFYFYYNTGSAGSSYSFRVVLSPQ